VEENKMAIEITEGEFKELLMEAWVAGWYDKEQADDAGKIAYAESVIAKMRGKIRDPATLEQAFVQKIDTILRRNLDLPETKQELFDTVMDNVLDEVKATFEKMKAKIEEQKTEIEELEEVVNHRDD
jgi:hypothetical protein